MLSGVTGCDDDSPTNPEPLDITGTYRYLVTTTPVSGDCSMVNTSLAGTMTFAKTPENTWQMTACTIDDQSVCVPYWWTVTVDGQLLTLSLDVNAGGVHVTIFFSGVVTDPAAFTLPGQITKEPGACRAEGSADFTRI